MLDERKIKAIELLIAGEHKKQDIAKLCGVSRQCLYDWIADEEFQGEFDKRIQEIKTNAKTLFNAKLNMVVDEWYKMMMDKNTEKRTKAKLLVDWVDRSLGKATTVVEDITPDKISVKLMLNEDTKSE